MMTARLRGDLVKAQCLYAMGGEIPDRAALIPWNVEPYRREAVAKVDAFFFANEQAIPTSILEVCLTN